MGKFLLQSERVAPKSTLIVEPKKEVGSVSGSTVVDIYHHRAREVTVIPSSLSAQEAMPQQTPHSHRT